MFLDSLELKLFDFFSSLAHGLLVFSFTCLGYLIIES